MVCAVPNREHHCEYSVIQRVKYHFGCSNPHANFICIRVMSGSKFFMGENLGTCVHPLTVNTLVTIQRFNELSAVWVSRHHLGNTPKNNQPAKGDFLGEFL
jgi:hypothetical protein